MKDKKLECFLDILDAVKSLDHNTSPMISEVITICKLLLVNPATSATGEIFFYSTANKNLADDDYVTKEIHSSGTAQFP